MRATGRRHPLALQVVLGAAVALLAIVAGAGPASAHATLIATVPAGDELLDDAPTTVQLQFDEPVDVVDGGVRVFGPDGSRVDQGRFDVEGSTLVVPIDPGGEGTYTVAWRALSEDNHNLESSFVFHVGTRTGAADIAATDGRVGDALGTVGRLLALGGMLALFGTAAIRLLDGADDAVVARLRPLAVAAAGLGAIGTVLVLAGSAAATSGRPALEAIRFIPDLAADTRTGRLVAIRGLVLAAAAVVAVAPKAWRVGAWPVFAAAVAAMGLLASSGHAWTADQRGLALVSDVGHQLAAGTWVGGAAALLVALRVSSTPSRLAQRFSTAALVGAVVIAATGTASALINTGSWDAVASTGYGRLVIAKVVGFAILVTFGWMNRRHLVPLVERTAAPLLRSVRWEVVAAVGVLAVHGRAHRPAARSDGGGPSVQRVRDVRRADGPAHGPARPHGHQRHAPVLLRRSERRPASGRRSGAHGRHRRHPRSPPRSRPRHLQPRLRPRRGADRTRHLDRRGHRRAGRHAHHRHLRGTCSMKRPPFRCAAAALIVFCAALAALGTPSADAHEGEGIFELQAQGSADSLTVPYVVRLTWANDGHPAFDATVTATPIDPGGTPQTPVPMQFEGDDGRYSGTITYPSAGELDGPVHVGVASLHDGDRRGGHRPGRHRHDDHQHTVVRDDGTRRRRQTRNPSRPPRLRSPTTVVVAWTGCSSQRSLPWWPWAPPSRWASDDPGAAAREAPPPRCARSRRCVPRAGQRSDASGRRSRRADERPFDGALEWTHRTHRGRGPSRWR